MGSVNLKVDEPSMEDILASIRRIISDEHEPSSETPFHEPSPSPLKTVLDIAERHASGFPDHRAASSGALEERAPVVQADSYPGERFAPHSVDGFEMPAAAATVAPAQASQRDSNEALMSRMTEAAVAEAFGRLGAARAASQPQTVEDLMKELLRPMLKAWLDENLPSLVERLVRAEIERVARG